MSQVHASHPLPEQLLVPAGRALLLNTLLCAAVREPAQVNAKTFLEKRYSEDMELEDAIHTALLTLKEGFEGERGMGGAWQQVGGAGGQWVKFYPGGQARLGGAACGQREAGRGLVALACLALRARVLRACPAGTLLHQRPRPGPLCCRGADGGEYRGGDCGRGPQVPGAHAR